MSIKSNKAKYLIENEGVPTSGGLLKSQMNKTAVVKVVEIAEEEMKQKAIETHRKSCPHWNSCKDRVSHTGCQVECEYQRLFIKLWENT